MSELPTGSDEVRKEADPVFRAIGKRFRDVRPIGVCIAPPDGLRSTAPAVDIWYSGADTSSVKIILSLWSNWSCGFSYVLKQALLKFTYLVPEGKFEM